jgi:hypothetical protein
MPYKSLETFTLTDKELALLSAAGQESAEVMEIINQRAL